NVGVKGLEGVENLNSEDYVHLFSTRNAPKITTAILAKFNSINFKVHEVPVKNQSVDMHLVTYLGYLIGIDGPSSNYIIVSKDNDYQNIGKYWKNENNITVTIQDNFIMNHPNSNSGKPIIKNTKSSDARSNSNSPSNSKNKELNNFKSVLKSALKKYGYSYNNTNKIIKIVSSHYGNEKFLMLVHNELQKTFEEHSEIYDVIKTVYNTASSDGSFSYTPPSIIHVFRTDVIFKPNLWHFPEYYDDFRLAVTEELKFLGYSKNETNFITNNLINTNNYNEEDYFKNLAIFLHKNFGPEKACEVYNIVKVMVLGDLIYRENPCIPSMTFGNGKYFSKQSPTLELYKVLNPIYTKLYEVGYIDESKGVCNIILKHYSKDNHNKLIRNEIISTYGGNIYSVINKFLLKIK
ncbi:hypothetical protein PIROE2DRAFT_4658, partial [Piromyces sp. E2]